MAAVRIRFRAELRPRWRSWLTLALMAGAAGGVVVALAVGAHRTQTAPHRYYVAAHAADAYVDPGFGFGEESLNLRRIERLPQVAEWELTAQLVAVARSRSRQPLLPLGAKSVSYLAPMDGRPKDRIDRPKLLRGRLPNPAVPDEALGDSRALQYAGLSVGDTLTLRLVSHYTLWHHADEIRFYADPAAARWGPLVTVRVVGESANARGDVDGGQFHLSPGFYRAHGGNAGLGSLVTELAVRLKHGPADLRAFAAGVSRIAGNLSYGFFDPSVGRPTLQRSMTLQARALELLAVLAGVAALLLFSQALFRQATLDAAGHGTLRALGMTRRQLVSLGAARALTMAAPAAVLTVVFAFLLSALAPIGRAREVEPRPGFSVDGVAFAVGGAAVFLFVLALGVLATWRIAVAASGGDAGWPNERAKVTSVPAALARAGCPPAFVAGVRMAIQRRARAAAVPVRAALVASVLAVGVTVAAITFAASLQHLLQTPALYGQTCDFEGTPPPGSTPPLIHELIADPAIGGLAPQSQSARSIPSAGRPRGHRPPARQCGPAGCTPRHRLRAPRSPDPQSARGSSVGSHRAVCLQSPRSGRRGRASGAGAAGSPRR